MSETILNHPSVWPNFLPGQPVARRAPEGVSLIEPCDNVRDHDSLGLPSIIDTISEIPSISEVIGLQSVAEKISPAAAAWEALGKCDGIVKKKYAQLLPAFCHYMTMCEHTGFRAIGFCVKGNDNGLRKINGPLLNRWHPVRRTAWIARLYQLTQWYEVTKPGCTMISLTGYQDGLSIYQTWDGINESRVKLLKLCRKHLGKFDYLWIVEPHTERGEGYPHYHLVIFRDVSNDQTDKRGEGMEDKLRRMWSDEWETGSHTYGLDFRHLSGDEGIKNLKNYLLKYISKGYVTAGGWGQSELIFNAHLFGATHGYRNENLSQDVFEKKKIYRLIGMSRPLSRLLRPEEDEKKEQIVWLHVDETEPIEYKNEKGEIVEDYDYKEMYDRQLIPDWFDTWRPLAKEQPWDHRVQDEKERLRKARLERERVSIEWSD